METYVVQIDKKKGKTNSGECTPPKKKITWPQQKNLEWQKKLKFKNRMYITIIKFELNTDLACYVICWDTMGDSGKL